MVRQALSYSYGSKMQKAKWEGSFDVRDSDWGCRARHACPAVRTRVASRPAGQRSGEARRVAQVDQSVRFGNRRRCKTETHHRQCHRDDSHGHSGHRRRVVPPVCNWWMLSSTRTEPRAGGRRHPRLYQWQRSVQAKPLTPTTPSSTSGWLVTKPGTVMCKNDPAAPFTLPQLQIRVAAPKETRAVHSFSKGCSREDVWERTLLDTCDMNSHYPLHGHYYSIYVLDTNTATPRRYGCE